MCNWIKGGEDVVPCVTIKMDSGGEEGGGLGLVVGKEGSEARHPMGLVCLSNKKTE